MMTIDVFLSAPLPWPDDEAGSLLEDAGQPNAGSATVYATACAVVFRDARTVNRSRVPSNSTYRRRLDEYRRPVAFYAKDRYFHHVQRQRRRTT